MLRGALDTINIGCIGTGNRCRFLLARLRKLPRVKIVALCDVWDAALAETRPLAEPDAIVTKDYRRVLDRPDVDAVVIATTDHWHTPIAVDACAAGKDVYVEKPLTHNLAEGPSILAAHQRYQRIVQVGMQQRSMPQFQKARELIRSGALGTIHKVDISWNRNNPRIRGPLGVDPKSVDWDRFLGKVSYRPFDEFQFRRWNWFWDFGGGHLTNLLVHYMDVANWFLSLKNPATAVTVGEYFQDRETREIPDTVQTMLSYPSQKVQVHFEATSVNANKGASMEFMGTEATLYVDRGRYEIRAEHNRKIAQPDMVIGEGPRGLDFYPDPDGEMLHLQNWVECLRSRKTPNATIEDGVRACEGPHLGNISLRSGKVVHWSAAT